MKFFAVSLLIALYAAPSAAVQNDANDGNDVVTRPRRLGAPVAPHVQNDSNSGRNLIKGSGLGFCDVAFCDPNQADACASCGTGWECQGSFGIPPMCVDTTTTTTSCEGQPCESDLDCCGERDLVCWSYQDGPKMCMKL